MVENESPKSKTLKEKLICLVDKESLQALRIILEIFCVIALFVSAFNYYSSSKTYNELLTSYNDLSSSYDYLESQYESLSTTYTDYQLKMHPYEAQADADEQAKLEQEQQEEEAKLEQEQQEKEQQQSLLESIVYDGTYKVGTDIPAGEYVMLAIGTGYFQITSDSSGSLDSIIANDNFNYNTIVTVSDGQYLQIKSANAFPIEQTHTLETTGEGMFKIGQHIPAGEYKIVADGDGYVEITSDSTHTLESIITNDNFDGEKYVTVSDGQYLKLNRAHIQQ